MTAGSAPSDFVTESFAELFELSVHAPGNEANVATTPTSGQRNRHGSRRWFIHFVAAFREVIMSVPPDLESAIHPM